MHSTAEEENLNIWWVYGTCENGTVIDDGKLT